MFVLERTHRAQARRQSRRKKVVENEKLKQRDKCNSLNVPSHGKSCHEKSCIMKLKNTLKITMEIEIERRGKSTRTALNEISHFRIKSERLVLAVDFCQFLCSPMVLTLLFISIFWQRLINLHPLSYNKHYCYYSKKLMQ